MFSSRYIVFASCCTLAGYWLELPQALYLQKWNINPISRGELPLVISRCVVFVHWRLQKPALRKCVYYERIHVNF